MTFTNPADYPFWFRFVVVITLVVFVINLFFFFTPVSELIIATSALITVKDIIAGIGTVVATFIGAWFAFKFARIQREKETDDNEVAAGNRALFTLSWMWNEIKQHQKEVVNPARNQPDSWLNLNVSQPLNDDLSFDLKDLSFVMQSNPTAFQQVFLEGERFRLAAHLVEEHRRLALVQTWPKLEAAGIVLGDNRPEREIQNIIGAGTVQQLKVTTAAIIHNFDENVISLRNAFVSLRTELKKLYPKRKFLDFNFPD